MTDINHSSRAHALLSASSSSRWLKCPPSALAATMYKSADSDFTREGTRAHEVAEIVARARLEGRDISSFPWAEDVTAEMVRCAEGYAEYVQELIADDDAVVLLEQRLDFSPWVPDGFGTGDCIIIQGNRLDVVDYKYGQGVAVSAEDNSQMGLYGLGALNDFGLIYDIQEVALHIYQPRMNNVSDTLLQTPTLLAWGEEVKPTAQDAYAGRGEYAAGPHCRFCPHAGSCPTLAASCVKVVKSHGGTSAVPSLAPWMVADILQAESMIAGWLKAVKDRAMSAMLNGEEIPGFKVVEGRSSRDWSNVDEVGLILREEGYSPEDIMTSPELLSPAKLERSIGKKRMAELVGHLVESKPGNPTVAPASDKRRPFDRLAAARNDFM